MNVRQFSVSRRSIAVAAALVGMVSLAIGAHAAFNKRALDTARTVATEQGAEAKPAQRIALVIGNGHYPDANAPLTQPINDARALTAALRGNGFDVDVVEDASRDDMSRAVDRLKSRIKPDSVVMLFFGGYGVQVGRESYMIPVDAAIWREADVRRQGFSVESVLDVMKEQGARAKLVVIDASRRNPYERRFRAFSHGLAPIDRARQRADPDLGDAGKVAEDSENPTQRADERAAHQPHRGKRCRCRGRLQQDPRRHHPRLRRRAGAVGILLAAGRRQPRRHRKRRQLSPTLKAESPCCTPTPGAPLPARGRGRKKVSATERHSSLESRACRESPSTPEPHALSSIDSRVNSLSPLAGRGRIASRCEDRPCNPGEGVSPR